LKLFLKEITDRYTRENFKRLQALVTSLANDVSKGSTTTITNNTVQRIPLDGTEPISGTIVPDAASNYDIGSTGVPLRGLYSDEVHVGPNTLYIDGRPAIGIDSVTGRLTYSSAVNQDLEVKSKGTGKLYIDSEGDIVITSTGNVIVNGKVITSYDFGRMVFDVSTIVGNAITLAHVPATNSERVILNGLELTEGVSYDYTRVNNVITFNAGVLTTDGHIKVDYAY